MSLIDIIKKYPISEHLDTVKVENATDVEKLEKILFSAVHYLLEHNPEKLFNSLYRIDVNEALVKEALEFQGLEMQAARISRLISERLFEKLEFRRKYSQR